MPENNLQKILGNGVSLERGIAIHNPLALTRELSVDPETRTVESLALTSEAAIYHSFPYGGSLYIILDHSETSVRLNRFRTDGPMLWEHNRGDLIGAWYEPKIVKRKIRANGKFSRVGHGADKFQDVQDGICRSISTGFNIYDLTPELDTATGEQKEENGTLVFRCFDWEPFEASLVSAPADTSVGVNRGLDPAILPTAEARNSTTNERTIMPDEIINPTPPNPAAPAPANPVVETRSAEDIVMEQIEAWAVPTRMNAERSVPLYLASLTRAVDASLDGFRKFVSEHQPDPEAIPVASPAETAARQGGEQPHPVQLARSVSRAGAITAFDRGSKEANLRAAYDTGSWALATIFRGLAKDRDGNPVNGGIFEKATRYAVEHGLITRALSEGNNAKGGYLVPDEISNDIIDLMLKYGIARRDTNVVQMKSDSLYVPRFVSGPEVFFVNESQEITESDLVLDQVGVFAKKLAALVVWSSELDEDAVIDIGNMVADKAARAFAKREDECLFLGTGSAYYGGMIGLGPALTALGAGTIGNVAGVQVGTGNTYAELVKADFVGVMARQANFEGSSPDRMKWYMSMGFYYNVVLNMMLALSGNSRTDYETEVRPRFLGYPVEFINVLPTIEGNSQYVAFFGDMKATVTMGVRRGFTFNESTEMRFKYDDIVGKATERFGLTVHSIGNSSATAADRLAGPMTALITAAS